MVFGELHRESPCWGVQSWFLGIIIQKPIVKSVRATLFLTDIFEAASIRGFENVFRPCAICKPGSWTVPAFSARKIGFASTCTVSINKSQSCAVPREPSPLGRTSVLKILHPGMKRNQEAALAPRLRTNLWVYKQMALNAGLKLVDQLGSRCSCRFRSAWKDWRLLAYFAHCISTVPWQEAWKALQEWVLDQFVLTQECWIWRLLWCALQLISNHKAFSYIAWHLWKDLLIWVFHLPSEPHWPVSWLVHWWALQTPSIVIHSSTFVNIFQDERFSSQSEPHWPVFWFLFWCGTLFPVQDWAMHGCSKTLWTFFEVNVSVHKVSCVDWCFDSCSDVQFCPSARLKQRMGVAQHCADSSRWTFQFTMWAVWIGVLFVLKPEHSER